MRILLVEDSKSIAVMLMEQLSAYGHVVTLARNGKEAVGLFQEKAPDLVLMDIEMPEMNGFEATLRIRAVEATQKWAWTPIIFLTASSSQDNLVTAIEAGADDFIAKPVTESVLQAKMKAMSRIAELRSSLSIANRQLEELATRDKLTGLFNRRYLDIRLNALWEQAVGKGSQFAVMMIDVDHFKNFNDRYGHQHGDDCLSKVAEAIESAISKTNLRYPGNAAFPARYGGEEFSVIIPGATRAMAEAYANAILTAIASLGIKHEENPGHGRVTASIGVSLSTPGDDSIFNAFRLADAALYQSKESGRNRATFS